MRKVPDRLWVITLTYLTGSRVFPRPFTHGGDLSPPPKALMGGTHEGGHRPYGGT